MVSARYAYIASPYTHASLEQRERRYEAAVETSALLAAMGLRLFSPIAHSHGMDTFLHSRGIDMTGPEWLELDKPMALRADVLIVLCLPGWEESVGVGKEIAFFTKMRRPIIYLQMDDFGLLEHERGDDGHE